MRIQLKQPEIEEAITNYLADQGIDTFSKCISMDFTAGRKNKGISVEVLVEEALIPPVEFACVPCTDMEYPAGIPQDAAPAEPTEEAKDPNPDATPEGEAQPAPTTSLFG